MLSTCTAILGYKDPLSYCRGHIIPSLVSSSLLLVKTYEEFLVYGSDCSGGIEGLAILDALPFEKEVLQSHSPKVNVSGLRADDLVLVEPISPKSVVSRSDSGVGLIF